VKTVFQGIFRTNDEQRLLLRQMHHYIYDAQRIMTMARDLGFKEEEDRSTNRRIAYSIPQPAPLQEGKRILLRLQSDEELVYLRKLKEIQELRTAYGSGASTGLGNAGSGTCTNDALGADHATRATMGPKVKVGILTQLKQLRKDKSQHVHSAHQRIQDKHPTMPRVIEAGNRVEESKSDSHAPVHDPSVQQRLVHVLHLLERLSDEFHCTGIDTRDTAILEEQTRLAKARAQCMLDGIRRAGAPSTAPMSAASARNPAEISPVAAHVVDTQSLVRVGQAAAHLLTAVKSPLSKALDTGVALLVDPEADPLKAPIAVASPQEHAAIDKI
jgi:hypothetical protein